ncbi:MAG: hypothetical protein BGO12_22670 [Verrucomicrobia bacterium 61-8]|nr:MAG: hypothetical protein BGO12_22670 [Verrucomicrobia bacterium 61-8]
MADPGLMYADSTSPLDTLYRELLKVGFVVLRQAVDAGDTGWIAAEIELLHNVPSLIGETNLTRHEYFWDKERRAYLEWVCVPGREKQKSRMTTYYEPLWNEMKDHLKALNVRPDEMP